MNEETKLKNKCLNVLKKHKVFYFKLSDRWYAGIPDVLVVHKGQAIWFELKTPIGKIDPIQEWTHQKLIAAGCFCMVIRSKAQFKEALREFHILKDK